MKSLRTRAMIAATVLLATAGTASAQALRADIPFTFKAGGASLQPGSYEVLLNNNHVVTMRNIYSGDAIFAMPIAQKDPRRRGSPRASRCWNLNPLFAEPDLGWNPRRQLSVRASEPGQRWAEPRGSHRDASRCRLAAGKATSDLVWSKYSNA